MWAKQRHPVWCRHVSCWSELARVRRGRSLSAQSNAGNEGLPSLVVSARKLVKEVGFGERLVEEEH